MGVGVKGRCCSQEELARRGRKPIFAAIVEIQTEVVRNAKDRCRHASMAARRGEIVSGYPKFFQSPVEHRKALWGTLVIAFFAILPLLILPLLDALRRTVYGPPKSIICNSTPPPPITAWDTISAGQLFM